MIRIWVYTPNFLVTHALVHYLIELGYDAHVNPEHPADLALWSFWVFNQNPPKPPYVPTLALLPSNNPNDSIHALRLGFQGVLRPEDGPDVLSRAINAIIRGEIWAPRNIVVQAFAPNNQSQLNAPPPLSNLTPREILVLSMVRLGFSNKDIASRLGNTESTIKTHLTSILSKMNAKRRTDLFLTPKEVDQQEH